MWHEARRMEKAVYQAINTTAKRKELARRAHDLANVSKDPSELLCIYGNALTIHTDANIAQAADESNTMTKWQGDESLIIDRFDARNLLDAIPTKPRSNDPEEPSNVEEYITALQLDYERFKELIAIAFTGECETTVLKNIAARDGRVALAKTAKKEKKLFNNKKPVNKKAAIKFNYDNEDATGSNDNAGPSNSKSAPREGSDSSDDDDNDDDELFSAKISSILFSTQDWERIDMIAEKFHLPRDAFSKLYEVDRGDELDVAKLQEIERERLSLSGRSSRRDRAKLKRRKKLILKDPLNDDAVYVLRRFAERRLREIKAEDASSSNSDDGEIEEKTEFITCFGESGLPTELPKTGSNRSPTRTTTNVTTSNVRTSRIKRDSRSASPFGDAWGSLKSTAKNNGETSEVVTSIKKPIVASSKPSGSGWLSSRIQNLRQKRSPSPVSQPSSRQSSVGKSGDDQPLVIRSSMSESEQERLEIENRKRRVRRTKRELKKRAKPSPDDNGSDDEESRKRAIAAKKLKQHLQANLSKTHREMLNDERDKKTQIENELKSRNAGDYVQRRPSRSLSPPHRQNQKSHSRSRSTSREAQNRRSMSRSPRRYRSRSRSPVRDYRRHTRNHRDRRSRSPHYRHRRSRSSERYHRRRRHYSRSRSPRDRR